MPRRRTRQKRRKTRRRTRRRKQRKRKRRRTKRRRRKRGGAPYKDFVVGTEVRLSTAGVMRVLEGNFHHNSPYSGQHELPLALDDPASWRGIVRSSSNEPQRRYQSSGAGVVVVTWRFPPGAPPGEASLAAQIRYEDAPGPKPWGGVWGWERDGIAGPVSDIEPLGRTHAQIPG